MKSRKFSPIVCATLGVAVFTFGLAVFAQAQVFTTLAAGTGKIAGRDSTLASVAANSAARTGSPGAASAPRPASSRRSRCCS
jgi:hypothetical protein